VVVFRLVIRAANPTVSVVLRSHIWHHSQDGTFLTFSTHTHPDLV
jgi:hypothetical protein